MMAKDPHRYDDIINLPHFKSKNRRHMTNEERAAQFAPFDALEGYDEVIEETGRTTENEVVLGENEIEELNMKFNVIANKIKEKPEVGITYFVPDLYKDGGMYKQEIINCKRIDMVNRILVSTDNRKYDLDYIIRIESELFVEEY